MQEGLEGLFIQLLSLYLCIYNIPSNRLRVVLICNVGGFLNVMVQAVKPYWQTRTHTHTQHHLSLKISKNFSLYRWSWKSVDTVHTPFPSGRPLEVGDDVPMPLATNDTRPSPFFPFSLVMKSNSGLQPAPTPFPLFQCTTIDNYQMFTFGQILR